MRLGEIIRQERLRQRLSYAQLAKRAGVTPPTVQRIESGKRGGRADTVARITRALGIDPAIVRRFLSGEDGTFVLVPAEGLAPGWLTGAMEDPELREDTKRLIRRAAEQDYRDSHER